MDDKLEFVVYLILVGLVLHQYSIANNKKTAIAVAAGGVIGWVAVHGL